MQGSGFKAVIIFLLLSVLAFIAGSLAADSASSALIPLLLVVGIFFLVYLGKNCWVLLFVIPPVATAIDLPFLRQFPVAFLVCGVVLLYMFMLRVMGYIKLRWNGDTGVDILTVIFFAYFLHTWVRHPVTIEALTSITDYGADVIVGGREYVWCIGAIICYIALSLIDVKSDSMLRVLKWGFWLSFVFVVFACARNLITENVEIEGEISNSRFGAFMGVSSELFRFLVAKYSVVGIALSPWKIVISLVCLVGVALSGFRSALLGLAVYSSVVSLLYRQLIFLILCIVASWGTIVYLSSADALSDLPHGVRRSISAIPGVEFTNDSAASDAQGSSEWRYEMWEWAMDPNKGYIHDYVWGDGFGRSTLEMQSYRISIAFGLMRAGDNKYFAANREWHNFVIAAIHTTGYVGVILAVSWLLYLSYRMIVLSMNMWKMRHREYAYMIFLKTIVFSLTFWISAADYKQFFYLFYSAAIYKCIYVSMKKENLISKSAKKELYKPLIMR